MGGEAAAAAAAAAGLRDGQPPPHRVVQRAGEPRGPARGGRARRPRARRAQTTGEDVGSSPLPPALRHPALRGSILPLLRGWTGSVPHSRAPSCAPRPMGSSPQPQGSRARSGVRVIRVGFGVAGAVLGSPRCRFGENSRQRAAPRFGGAVLGPGSERFRCLLPLTTAKPPAQPAWGEDPPCCDHNTGETEARRGRGSSHAPAARAGAEAGREPGSPASSSCACLRFTPLTAAGPAPAACARAS